MNHNLDDALGKVYCDVETERAVIASALMDGGEVLAAVLNAGDIFVSDACRRVARAAKRLHDRDLPVDTSSVLQELRRTDEVMQVGGASGLASITDSTTLAYPMSSVKSLVAMAARRRIGQQFTDMAFKSSDKKVSTEDFFRLATGGVDQIIADSEASTRAPMEFAHEDFMIDRPLPAPKVVSSVFGLTPGRPGMIAGSGGSGKTWVAQHIALCTLLGKDPLTHNPYDAGAFARVVHIDYEMTQTPIFRRYRAISYGLVCNDSSGFVNEIITDRNYLRSAFLVSSAPDRKPFLNDPNFKKICTRAVAGANLCIIDSLRASLPGVEENDSSVGMYLNMIAEISAQTQCAFLIIHHAGKNKDGGVSPRGSSAIYDACGVVWTIDSDKEDNRLKHMKLVKYPGDIACKENAVSWRFDTFDADELGLVRDVRITRVT